MPEPANPPGPPPVPRCSECGTHPTRPHLAECGIGAANARHWSNVHVVEQMLAEAVAAKRQDRAFMERLRANITKHADLLERLADA